MHHLGTRAAPGVAAMAALLALAACGGVDDTPPAPVETHRYSIEEFLESTRYRGGSFSSDNSQVLVGSNETGIFNAFAFPVAGGEPVQLTHSTTDSIRPATYFPSDERFLYVSDEGGNELTHVYVQDPEGAVTDLTPGEGFVASFVGWAQDDQSFFIQSTERDQRFYDLWEYQADDYARELLYQNDDGYFIGQVSPDGRHIALTKLRTTLDSDVYLLERASGEVTHLTPHVGSVSNTPGPFSPDGSSLYYLTDEGSEFVDLMRYDIEHGTREAVLRVDWDVASARFSKHGTYFVVGINNDARTELRLYDAATMHQIPLPTPTSADVTSVWFSGDESLVAFYASSSRTPSDLFVYDMASGAPRQLTRSLNVAIDSDALVDGEVVRFASYDGVEIPGILYRPHHASDINKVPALVWVHGGPGGQSRVGYDHQIQYFVNQGYAVYAINNRGSSGYGKTFFAMDDRKHGDADLDDCVASKQMLIETGWVDADRIGIIGGSYGGYMVLAALTFRPDAFAVGADYYGISNWYRTVNSMPAWWEAQREALEQEMGEFDDEAFFNLKSPFFHADQIVRPLIVLQGANDPRVLQIESDQIVEAVRANGVPVDYVLFEDEGHGFVKKENQAEAARRVLAFLDAHLRATS